MLKNMSIAQKLSAGFAIIVLIMVGVIGLLLTQLSYLNSTTDEMSDNVVPSISHIAQMRIDLGEARRNDLAHAMMGQAGYEENERDFKAAYDSFMDSARQYEAIPFASAEEEESLYRTSMESAKRYFTLHDKFATAVKQGDMELATRLRSGETLDVFETTLDNFQRLSHINTEFAHRSSAEATSVYEKGRQLGIGIAVLGIMFVIIVANFLIRQIRNPVMSLLDQTRKVAAGDLTTRLDMTHFWRCFLNQPSSHNCPSPT